MAGLFEGNDVGFNIGRALAYVCAAGSVYLRVWAIVVYYVIALVMAGLWYWINPFGVSLFSMVGIAAAFVVVPVGMMVRQPRVWLRVLSSSDLRSLRQSNRIS